MVYAAIESIFEGEELGKFRRNINSFDINKNNINKRPNKNLRLDPWRNFRRDERASFELINQLVFQSSGFQKLTNDKEETEMKRNYVSASALYLHLKNT